GSAGLDVAAATDVTLADTTVHLIPTGIWGPLGDSQAALLLGRSSTTIQGLFVLPGIIDADYTGEIKIMLWTPTPPCIIKKGSTLAQLIPSQMNSKPHRDIVYRGSRGFGSTSSPLVSWVQQIFDQQPTLHCTLTWGGHKTVLTGMIDTGPDVTVFS
ncbi:POK9 protein, partial [Eulacestoma nigropectus]|nr:POK9 protein [Eulacestoma nigropectus]